MLKISFCALVISILMCHVSIGGASKLTTQSTVGYTKPTRSTSRKTTPPAAVTTTGGTKAACKKCPPCPAGYGYTSSMGSCDCLCRWYGFMVTTAAPAGNSNSLLRKILTNIGSNAGSIADMANALQEELQIAQGLA